jgi:hypothetical protein
MKEMEKKREECQRAVLEEGRTGKSTRQQQTNKEGRRGGRGRRERVQAD